MATPYDIVQLTEIPSTQDEAAERFDETGIATLVIADRQSQGRGRQGRTWTQPDRAMFASLSFHNSWPMDRKTLIPLITADVVASAIDEVCGVEVKLKWPNDILVDGAKVGGILVETSGDRVTVGCGLNLWWSRPADGAAALFIDDPGRPAASDLAHGWARGLLDALDEGPDSWDPEVYLDRSATVGRRVSWDEGEGRATGIGHDGSLIVESDHGTVAIHAGDVHLHGSH